MDKKKFRTENHEVINRFLNINSNDKYFWPRECKISKKLLKTYPIEFLRELPEPFGTKFASLAWFLTGDGLKYINTHFFEYKKKNVDLSPKLHQIKLFETKIGEDVKVVNKPKTLKDFLNYGKAS